MTATIPSKQPALAAFAACLLVSCGGTGDSPSTTPSTTAASSNGSATSGAATLSADELAIASRLYKGTERTPPGFYVEPRPASVIGLVSTRHLKNVDVDPLAQGAVPQFEVCTNDTADAMAWSERVAMWNGQYSDMTELNANTRFIEVIRVPRADSSAVLRHRAYRCSFLDRSNGDLRLEQGAAGTWHQRPLDAAGLQSLSEYLWQFTLYNNADYIVVSSTGSATPAELRHSIRLAQLVRGSASSCDTVRISDWTHSANTATGALVRTLSPVGSFAARNTLAGAEGCAP
jgi:hypothetical protein